MQAYVEYFQTHGQEYLHMIWQHVYLSLLAVAIAAAIGIPCGILCLRVPKLKMKFRRIWIRFLMLVESDSG